MTFIKKTLFILAFLVVSSLADRCQADWRQIRRRLASAKRRWARKAPSVGCYNMSIEKVCLCPDCIGPQDVKVVRSKIQNPQKCTKDLPTVSELFDLVEQYCVKDCPSSGAFSCEVEFDDKYGYVTDLNIDVVENMKDEELIYSVKKLSFCKK
ncbi:hypothetical protein MPSEU_000108800 [Mayamaea pseudoterrestris]|nr:hypothetical protein MPSEU_000108800 [Mayamaea pseudoterrestris]